MKNSMQKLAVFVIIAAIAMFTVVATASAQSTNIVPWYEQSVSYAVTGSGQCIVSLTGFDPTLLTPLPPTASVASPTWDMYDGVYTLHQDGKFTVTLNHRVVTSAGGSWYTLAFNGTYAIQKDGVTVIFTTIPPSISTYALGAPVLGTGETYLSSGPVVGSISPDGGILEMHCGLVPFLQVLNPSTLKPLGPELSCNFTLVGFRCAGKCKAEQPSVTVP
jgi:hypothetical protein